MDIKPLTLNEYAKKRNEQAVRYGNKTMAPYMWKRDYETYYLPGLKKEDPVILQVYHNIKKACIAKLIKKTVKTFEERIMTVDIGFKKWACDDCGLELYDKSFPKNWIHLDRKFGDRCEKCKDKPDVKKG